MMTAGMQDTRGDGPGDISTYVFDSSIIVFQFTFSGTTYVVAIRSGPTGWVVVSQLPLTGANSTLVIAAAFNALTAGRTWKEAVVVKGSYVDLDQILLPSYVELHLRGYMKAKNNLNTHLVTNSDHGGGNTDITIVGGHYDANKENQADDMTCIHLQNVQRPEVYRAKVRGGNRPNQTEHGEGICLWNCDYGKVCENYCYEAYYDNIKIRGGSTHCLVSLNTCVDSETKGGIQIATIPTSFIDVIANVIHQNFHALDNGIRCHHATYVLIEGNSIYCYQAAAVQLIDDSTNITIRGNMIYTNVLGIHVYGNNPVVARPSDNVIRDNTVYIATNNNGVGIQIQNGDTNEVEGNTIFGFATCSGLLIGLNNTLDNRVGVNSYHGVGTKLVNQGTTTRMINPDTKQGGTINALSAANTEYIPASGSGSPNVDEDARKQIVAENCMISGFELKLTAAPGAGTTRTFTIRKNGAPTLLVLAFGAADAVKEDIQDWVEFSRGDVITIESTRTGAPLTRQAYYCYRLLPLGD